MQLTPTVWFSVMAAWLAAAGAAFAWHHRERRSLAALAVFNLSVVVWTGGNALQTAATGLDAKVLAVKLQYVGIVVLPLAAFAFAARFAGRDRLATRRRLAALGVPLAALLVLSWTNELHWLVRASEGLTSVDGAVRLERTFGPAFWVGWAYSNLLLLAATVIVVRMVLSTRELYRRQVGAMLVGALVPWVAQPLYLSGISPVEPETFFAVTGVAFVYAVTRYRYLDLLPVGRETVLEALDDGVVVVDEADRVVDMNAAAEELLRDAASVGTHVEEAFDTVPGLLSAYREADGGELLVEADGDDRRLDVRVSTLPDGERVVVLRDVTPLAERERELERKNRRLEEFASLVSHDLRGPLSIAAGYVDLERDERDSERLERAAEALDRMDDIIDDLLALAREDEPVEAAEAVDLGDLSRAAWAHVEHGAADLVDETDRAVEADPERLQRALENLFRNAVEHGDADEIRVGDLPSGFYVEDDGTGFDADPERLFEWGFTTAEGTGLGLAIVRRIAEAHGWDVRATESAEGGARFELTCED